MTEVEFNMELHRIKQHPIREQIAYIRKAYENNIELSISDTAKAFIRQHQHLLLTDITK